MNKEVVIYIYIYVMEYYSAVRKKEILPSVTTWMNLEDIMLSEISQTGKEILYGITYMWNVKEKNSN